MFSIGKVDANTMIVMDSFALPVEGTETRVNAQAQAYEYMTAYIEAAKQVSDFAFLILSWSIHNGCIGLYMDHSQPDRIRLYSPICQNMWTVKIY